MTEEDSSIGKQIGNYRIVAALGSGGFADVYQGQHLIFTNDPPVAIKLLYARLNTKEREQFIQEAQLLRKLHHPHILSVLDAGFPESVPYIVIEYAAQGSLQDRLDRQPGKPLPIDEALTILTQIGEALHYAHLQNIVHRDLKPDNTLFNAKGEALLADFGWQPFFRQLILYLSEVPEHQLIWPPKCLPGKLVSKVTSTLWVALPMNSSQATNHLRWKASRYMFIPF